MAEALIPLLAPLVIGTMIALMIDGVIIAQLYIYFHTFKHDPFAIRGVVIVLALLNAFHTALLIATQFLFNVMHYGDLNYVTLVPWPFSLEPALCGVVAFIVQSFYAWRVYRLNGGNKGMPAVILAGTLWQFGWAVAGTYICFHVKRWDKLASSFTYGVSSWLGGAAGVDILIAVTLVILLRKTKGQGFNSTDNVLDYLITLVIESNGLTAMISTLHLILFAVDTTSAGHTAPFFALVKLYVISTLVSLNSRIKVTQKFSERSALNKTGIPTWSSNDIALRPSVIPLSADTSYSGKESAGVHVTTIVDVLGNDKKVPDLESKLHPIGGGLSATEGCPVQFPSAATDRAGSEDDGAQCNNLNYFPGSKKLAPESSIVA